MDEIERNARLLSEFGHQCAEMLAKMFNRAGLTIAPLEPTPEMVAEMAVRLLIADEGDPETPEMIAWARRALKIGEDAEHSGDCTKEPHTCQICERERYQRMARAAYRAGVGREEG